MKRAEILEAARVCVCGEREQDYGTPEDSFALIGKLWTAYMGVHFTPKDVAMMMALLKVARIKAGDTADSFVDLAGYAACAGEIATEVKCIYSYEKYTATGTNTVNTERITGVARYE